MKVLIIDKADIYRIGLVSLLRDMNCFSDVIELEDEIELIDLVSQLDEISLVILNPEFSEYPAISSVSYVCRLMPKAKVMLISDEEDLICDGVEVIDRKQPAFALKSLINGELKKRRSTLEKIDVFGVDQSIRDARHSIFSGLSQRRLQVLKLIADGHSNREISAMLGLKEGTVRAHAHAVLKRLGVESRTQAALMYRNVSGIAAP
nr:response regulator transcription factor [Kordiimonas laminariae]